MTSQTDILHEIIDPIAEAMGYEIVRILLKNSERGDMTLQVMAERPDGTMLIDDCEKLSREISVILDVEDPISMEYVLEVSTPGIDRPLTRHKDFVNYAGNVAKIELATAENGRRRFRGMLHGIEGDLVRIEVDGEIFELDFDNIHRSKLVLTDELLAKAKMQ